MRIRIQFEEPDAQILDLNDDQADLWRDYSDKLERVREVRGSLGWDHSETSDAYDKVDEAYDKFARSIGDYLEWDLPVGDIKEW